MSRCVLVAIVTTLLVEPHAGARPAAQERGAAAADDYRVMTPSGVVLVSAAEWKAMPTRNALRENFEQRAMEARQKIPRLVTVVKLHMTDDARLGAPMSPTEYLEIWVEPQGTLTAQIRVDKGRYWVMSRETLVAPTSPFLETPVARQLSEDELAIAQEIFRPEIERTRFLLQSQF